MRKTAGGGLYAGSLSRGCTQCIRGAKMVLFVTGVCDVGCFYCPVSFKRANIDAVYANERVVSSDNDILDEARRMRALGTGITGGDPLIVPERTAHYISLLKGAFGPSHHIHLYTGRPNLRSLPLIARAGLDEIRIHPPESTWSRFHGTNFDRMLKESRALGMRAGLEVPAIPGMESELAALITDAAVSGAQFVNLNELEMSESNAANLRSRGYELANDFSNSISGSAAAAENTVRRRFPVPVHYCPSTFKDAVQLRERMKRMAAAAKWSGDVVTDDGTLLRGIIETHEPERSLSELKRKYGIPSRFIRADELRKRIEIAPWIVEEIAQDVHGEAFIVEEYPTVEKTEVERRPVTQR